MNQENIYSAPSSELGNEEQENIRYAGFWIRVLASLVDTFWMMLIILPLLTVIYGTEYWVKTEFFAGTWDILLNYAFPALAVIVFWVYKSATPGKMVFGLMIIDAKTGEKASNGQLIGRYLGYYLSVIPLGLGILWVAFGKDKRGWHDLVSGTAVKHRRSAS